MLNCYILYRDSDKWYSGLSSCVLNFLVILMVFPIELKVKEIDLCTPIDKQTLCVRNCLFLSFIIFSVVIDLRLSVITWLKRNITYVET